MGDIHNKHENKKQGKGVRNIKIGEVGIIEAMAPHSSTLAWKIPGLEEPGRLQSMGSRRVGHD